MLKAAVSLRLNGRSFAALTDSGEAEPWANELMEYLKCLSYGIANIIKAGKEINIEKIFAESRTRKILTGIQDKQDEEQNNN